MEESPRFSYRAAWVAVLCGALLSFLPVLYQAELPAGLSRFSGLVVFPIVVQFGLGLAIGAALDWMMRRPTTSSRFWTVALRVFGTAVIVVNIVYEVQTKHDQVAAVGSLAIWLGLFAKSIYNLVAQYLTADA